MHGKILITGGLGNLGSWISQRFCELNYDVYILTRKEKVKLKNLSYTVIEADITDLNLLKEKLTINFDYCIHLASFNEFFLENYPKKALEINALGTRNLLEVLSSIKLKKFIYLSTVHVYGVAEGNINELSSLNPQNDYAMTHLFAEYYVKQFASKNSFDYTIFRLTNSYGAPKKLNTDKWYLILNDLVKSAFDKKKIILKSNGNIQKDFIWMGDVVNIIDQFISNIENDNDIYNLSQGKSISIIELAELIKREYTYRYNFEIKIDINIKDKKEYKTLFVDNQKLLKKVSIKLENHLTNEINNIFSILEGTL